MDESAVVCPPALAGPVVLHPFRALHLAADRVGSAAGARAFASPHERVPRRLAGWLREGLAVQEDVPAVWVHEYTARGMTVRGVVGALDLSHPAGPGTTRAVLPHERVLPAQVDELERRIDSLSIQTIALRATGSATAGRRRSCWRTGPARSCAPWSTGSSRASRTSRSPTPAASSTGRGR